MAFSSISMLAFAAIISVIFAAPATHDQIDRKIQQTNCAINTILDAAKKHELGDIWSTPVFALVMHVNNLYECKDLDQDESDECVKVEMGEVEAELSEYLFNVRKMSSVVADELNEEWSKECGFQLVERSEHDVQLNKIQFKKFINIEHIKCVTSAIAVTIGDNEDALNWISIHLELKDSVARILSCGQYIGLDKKVCVVSELRTTVKILVDLWKFLSEKKHIEVLGLVKAAIKDQCYQQQFYY